MTIIILNDLAAEVEEYLQEIMDGSPAQVSERVTWAGRLHALLEVEKKTHGGRWLLQEMSPRLLAFFSWDLQKTNNPRALSILRKLTKTGQEIAHAP